MPRQPAANKAATAPVGKAKPTAKKKAKASPKKKAKTDSDDDEDEEDYDYDAEDYDAEEEEEEDAEEDEEDEEDEGEEEDEGDEEEETKEKKKAKKGGLAKMQEETAARFEAIDSRITVFMQQFSSLIELHEAYNNAQKSGGWCCKSDLKALKAKVDQPAKEPLVLTTLAQSVARLEKQMVALKEQLAAQEQRPIAQIAMEKFSDGAAGAPKPTPAPTGVSSPTAAVHNEELMKQLKLFIKISETRHEQLEAQVQCIEMQFTGRDNCLACGTYSPPSTAIGDRSLDQKPGSRRNRVGAPVAQFLSREWDHDKFDPARPSLKKGGGFNTTASSFFGDSSRKQMSASQSSPTMLGSSRRKRAGYTADYNDTSKLDGE